ncbi:UNVERIFIED_CONTAM: tRNA-dihydrouridine(20) synthase [NAD(P)+]-like [Sesamum radiatum]|uniref:tRNA-dihydrouridine(20) synthase [NAD(P)+]-like n=1 Tax=Sesamum radiatum TaxID=300843 RepID=A0AAW2RCP2_SESRA
MEIDYRNKLVLAPMVRVVSAVATCLRLLGTLPFRLLAAEYGADITYGEEIIDHKLLKCERRINDVLGTIDVVEKGTDTVVFRTCSEEKNQVVFQMGTSDAVRALRAAQNVCMDVAAVDINMGCPKSFSISGGMGAALLTKPDLIHDILTTLKRNLNTPVTCKIRLLNSPQDTVELARRIEKTGVSALAVHGRKVTDRPRDPAKWSEIADVVAAVSIPVIANGDVFEYEDFGRIKVATGASSVMVARGALWNASIFSPEGKLRWEDVKREYVRKSILWDNDIKSTKHTLKEMIMHYSCLELPEGKAVIKSDTLADLARHYGEDSYYELINKSRSSFGGNFEIHEALASKNPCLSFAYLNLFFEVHYYSHISVTYDAANWVSFMTNLQLEALNVHQNMHMRDQALVVPSFVQLGFCDSFERNNEQYGVSYVYYQLSFQAYPDVFCTNGFMLNP